MPTLKLTNICMETIYMYLGTLEVLLYTKLIVIHS